MAKIELKDLAHASVVINRIASRMQKRVVGLLSPTILTVWKEKVETEIIGRFLIPCEGTITTAMIKVPLASSKNPVSVTMTIGDDEKAVSQTFVLTKPYASGVLGVPVSIGALVTVRVDTPGVEDISLSAVFVPVVGEYKVENYLLDDLEKTNEGIRDSLNESVSAGTTDGLAQPT